MSDKVKLLRTYVLMVGVPLAGLFGILHAGRGLQAPIAIGGDWRIDSPALVLTVEQSGEHLAIARAGRQSVPARLRGDSVYACVSRPGFITQPCDAPLLARIDRSVQPQRMSGLIAACDDCSPIEFTATRVPAARPAKGSH